MKETPILFSGPMVRAILDGRKNQTRRVVTGFEIRGPHPPPPGLFDFYRLKGPGAGWCAAVRPDGKGSGADLCPYGVPGDHLWVRETWADHVGPFGESRIALYRADGDERAGPWRPSILMPRWASRLTLEVTEVRVQRLQEITEKDAQAEGAEVPCSCYCHDETSVQTCEDCGDRHGIEAFRALWDSINGSRAPWESNPWVWAVSFRRVGT